MFRFSSALVSLTALTLFMAAFVFLGTTLVAAQETTGGLQGTVTDPSGAVISGADVTVTSPALLGEKSLTTGASGYYRFANLPPGTYAITASGAAGVARTRSTGVR